MSFRLIGLSSHFVTKWWKSMTHEIFLCITSCTRGYGFDRWVFEPSFPSFLSPYHLGLRYVPCLKTTLRPRDQTLSLTVFTWTGFCRLVEVWSLLCSFLWKILLEAFGFSLAWHIDVWWIFWVWRQFIEDIRFILLSCTRHPYWGIFPPYSYQI